MTYHDIIHTIIQYRTQIIKVTTLTTIFLFLILFFIYPISYRSNVTILPPEKNTSMGGLSSLISGQDFSSILTGGMSNANTQLYAEILRSRSVSVYVVKKLNLQDYYDEVNIYKAAQKLSNDIDIEITKEGILKLNVEVKTKYIPMIFDDMEQKKNLSAQLSNTFIEALDKINREKLSSKAKKARIYIESQLEATKIQLDSVENALMEFQKKNKTISLPEQLKAAIEAAAEIKTEMVKTEVELGIIQSNLREDDRTVLAVKKKIEQLKEQYSKMELGNDDYLVAFKEVPELAHTLARLLRDVKIQNEVYMILQQQYYQEKIQENRDLPTVEILDEAIPPLKASSPRTIFSSLIGGIFSFMLMSLFYLIKERKNFELKEMNKEKVGV
ncbi:MAG: GNVR domain-containing protein [Ignavibacteria bacterium]|nr:GNVR domain-containing protein [Ignavibacteria bacterium]